MECGIVKTVQKWHSIAYFCYTAYKNWLAHVHNDLYLETVKNFRRPDQQSLINWLQFRGKIKQPNRIIDVADWVAKSHFQFRTWENEAWNCTSSAFSARIAWSRKSSKGWNYEWN